MLILIGCRLRLYNVREIIGAQPPLERLPCYVPGLENIPGEIKVHLLLHWKTVNLALHCEISHSRLNIERLVVLSAVMC